MRSRSPTMERPSSGAGALGLLTFSRNDADGVIENVERLRPVLAQVIVVDSSLPPQRSKLERALRAPQERVYVTPPLGNCDLLRPLGVSQMTTERVLVLDSDETLSEPLRRALPDLTDADAFVLPRWERGARGFTYHLRLFRRRAVRYYGPSYAFPRVDGSTRTLERALHIVHEAPTGPRYWEEHDRARRYLLSDFLERPYDGRYFRQALGVRSDADAQEPPASGPVRPLSRPATRLALWLEALRTLVLTQSPGLAASRLEQGRQRLALWGTLSPEEQAWLLSAASQVRRAGGLVRFLHFDDPAYVDRLNEAFDATTDGPDLLKFLLHVRADTGSAWDGRPPYPTLSRAPGKGVP